MWGLLFVGQALVEAYVEMRKVGSGRGQVSAYPRQLESLIRLAEAHARMRLSDIVEVDDVQEARRLTVLHSWLKIWRPNFYLSFIQHCLIFEISSLIL